MVTVQRVGVRYKISDPPTSPSLICLNGFCGRKAPCFLYPHSDSSREGGKVGGGGSLRTTRVVLSSLRTTSVVLNSCFYDTVFVTLFPANVET